MKALVWWLRVTGVLYIVNGIMMAFVKAPIRSAGPPGALDRAAAGDAIARFLTDTWFGFGIEVIAIGLVLLFFSTKPQLSVGLVWSVIAIEVARGLFYDSYMLSQGYAAAVYVPWLAIHSLVILAGVLALRRARKAPASHDPFAPA